MIRLTSKTSSEICWVERSSELLVLREGKTGLKTSPDPESIKIYSWWPQTRCHSLFFPMIWFSRTRIRVGTSEKRWEPGWRNKNSFLTEGNFLTAAHAGGQERRWGLSSYENTEVLGHCSWLDFMYTTCIQSPQWPEEGDGSPEAGITGSYEPPYAYWELNQDPLKNQYMLLTPESSAASLPRCFQWLISSQGKMMEHQCAVQDYSVWPFNKII